MSTAATNHFPKGPFVKVHLRDETYLQAIAVGKGFYLLRLGLHVVLVNHAIDLYRCQPGLYCCLNAFQCILKAANTGDGLIFFRVHGVEAYVDTVEACFFKLSGKFGEHDAVGGHAEVCDPFDPGDHPHQVGDAFSYKRFTACDPDLVHTHRDSNPYYFKDFIKIQDILMGQQPDAALRHAIRASQVASVGYRHPQVIDISIISV